MKQVYTVKEVGDDPEQEKSIFLREGGNETYCPNSHNNSNCGDWCPMFEFNETPAEVVLHCCKRVIPVEVEE